MTSDGEKGEVCMEERMEQEWAAEETAGELSPEAAVDEAVAGAEEGDGAEAPQDALERERAQWQQERLDYERRIAQLQDDRLNWEAAKLAKEEGISEQIALRLLRAERGQPVQPADGVRRRAESLMRQAELVQRATGMDVLEMFRSDAEVRRRVSEGEWDFADAVAHRRPADAAPVRSAGAARDVGRQSFSRMSREAFERFDEMLKTGEFDASR
ncbi:MAG: hypothetical protein Q4E13_04810 [Clostridia bacterium]|nr:hypothetical protein [Clostridia bacterium]